MATLPDTMSQADPWAWLNWAQQRDPGTYGWRGQSATLGGPGNPGNDAMQEALRAALVKAGIYDPNYQSGQFEQRSFAPDDGAATWIPNAGPNPYDGYTFQEARGPGYQHMQQLIDPSGSVLWKDNPEYTDSFHSDTYRNALGTVGAVLGAGYGLEALAGAGGAGAGAAAGGADAATSAAWANGAGLGGDTLGAMGAAGGGGSAAAAGLAPLAGIEGMGVSVAPTMTNSALAASGSLSPELAAVAGGGQMAGGATLAGSAGGLGGASMWDQMVNRLGNTDGSTWAGLAGAALGAAEANANNKPSTSTKDPWAAAVPFLRQQLDQGQQLSQQYAAQPFNQAQQTSYNNLGGLLNSINGGAGGLLSGMGANASGANQFDRANPARKLQGGSLNLGGWSPGLLQFFPGAK